MLVQPGQPVKIVFENADDMPHNIVFCQPGTDTAAMAMKQMEKPEEALKRNWLPDDPRIWAHSKMLNPHEKEELTFTAPEKPGTYPYVCTFPGPRAHHAGRDEGRARWANPARPELRAVPRRLEEAARLLQAHAAPQGKVEDNLIQMKLDDYKNQFGVVFTGKLNAPKKGAYRFYLASDDGARILIDGKEVVKHDGIHPASDIKEKGINLEKGEHEFRLEYFQGGGDIEILRRVEGRRLSDHAALEMAAPANGRAAPKKKNEFAPIPLVVKDEPVIYRNFIQGAGNRGIAVGYPGGINIAWSAESMNLALLWRGAFIDASKHWNSRGGGYQPRSATTCCSPRARSTPAFFVAASPMRNGRSGTRACATTDFAWKGYTLDAKRNPTFRYTWNGAEVEESFTATRQRQQGRMAIPHSSARSRSPATCPPNAWFRLATGSGIEQKDGAFECQSGSTPFRISAEGAKLAGKNLRRARQGRHDDDHLRVGTSNSPLTSPHSSNSNEIVSRPSLLLSASRRRASRRRSAGVRLLQDHHFRDAEGNRAGGRLHRPAAGRQARARHAPRRNLDRERRGQQRSVEGQLQALRLRPARGARHRLQRRTSGSTRRTATKSRG